MLIRLLLIAATSGASLLLLRRRSAMRARAWKRLVLVALVAAAIVSILKPELTTAAANAVGVGRGSDLLLYMLTAVFLFAVVSIYLKFRDLESQMTALARRLAIGEAMQDNPNWPARQRPPSSN